MARRALGSSTLFPRHRRAAGPQGRDGLRTILRTIEVDLGPTGFEPHHLIAEGDFVIAPFTTNDGTCQACAHDMTSGCEHGSTFGVTPDAR